MMEEVHAPADLLGKVKGIPMEKRTKAPAAALKVATAAMVAVVGVFAVTNGVCYAATGETWIEKAVVMVNGSPVELDVKMTQNGDVTIGEVTYEVADDDSDAALDMTVVSEGGDPAEPGIGTFEITDYTAPDAPAGKAVATAPVLERDDGRVYVAPEGTEPVEVTEQLAAEGAAIGEYEADGVTYVYKVAGEKGAYHATVERA